MTTAKYAKILLLHLLLVCFLLWAVDIVYADTKIDDSWHSIETKYLQIHYHSLEDLKKFTKKIDYSPGSLGLKGIFEKKKTDDLTNIINQKVDAVYERVQEILDMKKLMEKVKVNIYQSKKQLHEAYQTIFKKPCRFRAWYTHEENTIYLNVDDVNEGMLAHEIAHSIIDHYLSVRPPKATAEILARYVDGHLFD